MTFLFSLSVFQVLPSIFQIHDSKPFGVLWLLCSGSQKKGVLLSASLSRLKAPQIVFSDLVHLASGLLYGVQSEGVTHQGAEPDFMNHTAPQIPSPGGSGSEDATLGLGPRVSQKKTVAR